MERTAGGARQLRSVGPIAALTVRPPLGPRPQGSHCEGSLLRGLFPIFMWRVLFADVPHAFVCPYQVSESPPLPALSCQTAYTPLFAPSSPCAQDAPLDLDSRGAFLRARSALAQEVLAGIRTMSRGELVQTIRDAYREVRGSPVGAAPMGQSST